MAYLFPLFITFGVLALMNVITGERTQPRGCFTS